MKYRTIVADPPWKVMGGSLKQGVGEGWNWPKLDKPTTRPLPYPTMGVDEVGSLAVDLLAENDCALYLWTINAYVEHAWGIARRWGFKPSTLHTWCKAPMGGGLGGAHGITSEYFLYARRGSPHERRHTGTWHEWKRHYINGKPAHSAKPDAFYDLVEQVNDGPYLELFARRQRLGWDTWGDEALEHVELACPAHPFGPDRAIFRPEFIDMCRC